MTPDLESLSFIIGTWTTRGEVRAQGNTPAMTISGTDSYEWTLGRKFILHKVDVSMGDTKVEAIEFISPDPGHGSFKFRSFDDQGAFTEMEGHLDEKGVLHIVGNGMRTRLSADNDRHMTARWERTEDNKTWIAWMDLTFSK